MTEDEKYRNLDRCSVVNITLDRIFVKIEKRGLAHLLIDGNLALYQAFLAQPAEYRDYIRELEKDD